MTIHDIVLYHIASRRCVLNSDDLTESLVLACYNCLIYLGLVGRPHRKLGSRLLQLFDLSAQVVSPTKQSGKSASLSGIYREQGNKQETVNISSY